MPDARQPLELDGQPEISRLLAAAVINRNFCALLLTDPETALERGFQGEQFHLAPEDKRRLMAIRTTSLVELARQLIEAHAQHQPVITRFDHSWKQSG